MVFITIVIHVRIKDIRITISVIIIGRIVSIVHRKAELLLVFVANMVTINILVALVRNTVAIGISYRGRISRKIIILIQYTITILIRIDRVWNAIVIDIVLIWHIGICATGRFHKVRQPVAITIGINTIGNTIVIDIIDGRDR